MDERFFVITIVDKNNVTNDKVYRKVAILMCIRKCLISGHKAEKQLRNQNHTEDWALGCHPRDNHQTRDSSDLRS